MQWPFGVNGPFAGHVNDHMIKKTAIRNANCALGHHVFVLDVPVGNLLSSMVFVLCDHKL